MAVTTNNMFDQEDLVAGSPPSPAPSSPFDPEDVVSPVKTAPVTVSKKIEQDAGFDPEDLAAPKPEEQQLPPDYAEVRKTIERPFLAANVLGTEATTDKELDAIARFHNVDPNELKKYASFFGARREQEEPGTAIAGSVARGLALNLPQFAIKKMQTDPNFRKALDDVQSLGDAKRSQVQGLAENLLPGGVVLKAAEGASMLAKMAKAALAGSATGTAASLGRSEEGKELESAAIGATAGAVLGGAIPTVAPGVKYLFGSRSLPRVEAEAIDTVSRNPNIQKGIDEMASRTRESEDILERIVSNPKNRNISTDEAVTILEQQLPEKRLQKILSDDSKEVEILSRQAGRQLTGEEAAKILANDIIEDRLLKVASEISDTTVKKLEKAVDSIEDYANRQGKDGFLNKYRNLVELENATKYLQRSGEKILDQPNFAGKVMNFVSDAQFVLQRLDSKYGTDLRGILSDASRAYNKSTYALTKFRTKMDDIFRSARKLGTDRDLVDGKKIYNAIDTGNYSGLSKQEIDTANQVKDFFGAARDYVNKVNDQSVAPLSIPERANYIPKMIKKTEEATSILTDKLSAVEKQIPEINQLSKKELYSLAKDNADVKDLIDTSIMMGKKFDNGRSLTNNIRELTSTRRGSLNMETKARAALAREGEIPDFLLEKNVYKLMDMWTANTVRHLYLRNSIDKLATASKVLGKAGADVESKYVADLVKDIMGVRQGTMAEAYLQSKVFIDRKLDSIIKQFGKDSIPGGVAISAKAIPDMLNAMTRQIYPNMLGYFSPRAVLQNATALFTKVAPEIGGIYGYKEVLRGATYAALNFKRLSQKAANMGTVPDEFIRKGEQAIAEGIQRSALYQIPAKALDGMAKAGMTAYQASEKMNRVTVLALGELLAKDIAAGRPGALKSLAKFPPSVRSAVKKAGSTEEVGNLLGAYLNDVTQYNYNRLTMSEFGRTAGPFFSTFSKWPTATAGEILYELETKGALKGSTRLAEKFIAPLLLLQGVDVMLGAERPDDDSMLGQLRFLSGMGNLDRDSSGDRYKKLAGSSGFSQAAPIGSLAGIANGEIFSPPAMDAIVNGIIKPAIEGDSAKISKGIASMANNFVPGAGAARFITDDVVTLVTGERPEGKDFFERTAEGARLIDRELGK
jgi:hypothetical protein